MIKGIKIENFRCFSKLNATKFGRVNLFGGQNNSGKTALLEALYLAAIPNSHTVQTLFFLREPDIRIGSKDLKQVWNNLFYERDIENTIRLKLNLDDEEIEVSLRVLRLGESVNIKIGNSLDEERLEFFSSNDLQIKIQRPNKSDFYSLLKVQNGEIVVEEKTGAINALVDFHPANSRVSRQHLVRQYSNAALEKGNSELMIEAFQLFDKSIVDIRIFDVAGSSIYLSRDNRPPMPLSMYGDAMIKMAQYTLSILSRQGAILLIDEIENGIHHTNHEKVWKFLFDLARRFHIQIFATSHSGEMINAFTKVASLEESIQDYRYFELTVDQRSPNIIVNYIPISALESKIEGNRPYRGEI